MRARFLGALLLTPAILQPCTCSHVDVPPCAIQLNAGALFTGTVVARLPFVYSVHVEEIFSGLPAHTKHLFLHSGPPCGSFFELGGRYLFHAAKPGRFSNNLYSAGRCSGTRSAAAAAADIAWLRAHARRAQPTRIFGTVVRNGGWNPFRPLEDSDIPIPYAQVTITGQGKTYNTLSASDGSYNFEGIPPGPYRISAQKWPWPSSSWTSFELRNGTCARLLLHIHPTKLAAAPRLAMSRKDSDHSARSPARD